MSVNHRDYLKVLRYGPFWALDYSSPSVGMTLKWGTEEQVKAEHARVCALSDDQLHIYLLNK
jgi:hypothetical protein